MLDVERHAWDRRPDESPKAHVAFREYRDMGPLRSLSKMSTTSRRNAVHWSARHGWVARAALNSLTYSIPLDLFHSRLVTVHLTLACNIDGVRLRACELLKSAYSQGQKG